MDLIERMDRWSHEIPKRVAHIGGNQTLTYRELARHFSAMADFLTHQLLDDQSPIAVLSTNTKNCSC